jgi:hypothetical protein
MASRVAEDSAAKSSLATFGPTTASMAARLVASSLSNSAEASSDESLNIAAGVERCSALILRTAARSLSSIFKVSNEASSVRRIDR